MVNPITWVWLIYDFMVAAFVRITHFLRYISEFTLYASVVNRENSMYTVHVHAATFVWITRVYFIIFRYLLPIVPVRLRWCNVTERQNLGIFIDIKFTALVFNTVRYTQGNFNRWHWPKQSTTNKNYKFQIRERPIIHMHNTIRAST